MTSNRTNSRCEKPTDVVAEATNDLGFYATGPGSITNQYAFYFESVGKSLGYIKLDGTIVIEMTEEELQEISRTNFVLKPYAILMLEILRLRKQV